MISKQAITNNKIFKVKQNDKITYIFIINLIKLINNLFVKNYIKNIKINHYNL